MHAFIQFPKKKKKLSYRKLCCLVSFRQRLSYCQHKLQSTQQHICAVNCKMQLIQKIYNREVHRTVPQRGGCGSIPRQSVRDPWCVRLASCKPFPGWLCFRLQIMTTTVFLVLQREKMHSSSRCVVPQLKLRSLPGIITIIHSCVHVVLFVFHPFVSW